MKEKSLCTHKKMLFGARAYVSAAAILLCAASLSAEGLDAKPLPEGFEPKGRKQSLYLDMYRETFHKDLSHIFRLNEIARQIKRPHNKALDVNAFDEVPDSLFFTNRHGRSPLSGRDLEAGPAPSDSDGPDGGTWAVLKGKAAGMNKGMFIEDGTGTRYLLKFDPPENSELASSAEAISSRIFHAVGYNVPEYHVITFRRDQLTPAPEATYHADSGFKKPLTQEGIDEILTDVPILRDGTYRASASKILPGKVLGRDTLRKRRKKDPNDVFWHRDRRSFRALQVFAAWTNYYDLNPQNTMEVVEDLNGTKAIRHYVFDFGSTLGSAGYDAKPPVFGFEHIFDGGEVLKSIFTLGFYDKPWQKRLAEENPSEEMSSLGHFDNRYFNPGAWKTQLQLYAFKELTASDAFWAAKIITQFRDEHISDLVKSGKLSDPDAAKKLTAILSERRDMIGRYWFEKVSPLDRFDVRQDGASFRISFTDLSVEYGFVPAGEASYRYDLFIKEGPKEKVRKINSGEGSGSPLTVSTEGIEASAHFLVKIAARYGASKKWHPPVSLEIKEGQLKSISHE